jgi:hypothetical protein
LNKFTLATTPIESVQIETAQNETAQIETAQIETAQIETDSNQFFATSTGSKDPVDNSDSPLDWYL